jgi:5-methylcytosine-specific restriction endonuclease McrA
VPRPRPSVAKICPRCKVLKTLEAFYSSEKYDGGYSTYCKECVSIANKASRNPERDKKYAAGRLRWYQHNKDRVRATVQARKERIQATDPAKWRALRFFDGNRVGIASDVTLEYIANLFRTVTHCQCCEKPLVLQYEQRETREYRSNPDVPSVDRVNNDKGYSRSNIAIICWECNFRKTDLTLADLERMIGYVKLHGDFDAL